MTITNGTIEFSRRVKTGDYEHKDAKVSLSFDEVFDGDLERIGQMAVEHALVMVGEVSKLETAAAYVEMKAQRAAVVVTDEHQDTAERVNAPRPVIDIMGNPTSPSVIPVSSTIAETVSVVTEAPASAEAEPITDKRLLEEIMARNSHLLNAAGQDNVQRELASQKIVKLVTEYSGLEPGPGRATKIPADQRARFIKALGELT